MDIYELFEYYRTFQSSHSHLGSMLTAEAVYVTGDLVSQFVNGEKIDAPSYLVKAKDEVTFVAGFNPVVAREMKLREEQAKEQEK